MKGLYRVLAADDEIWCRESMKRLIKWEDYNIDFLEPACDGEEVMERLATERVDILLTDINMPFLSGLELMERVKAEYPEVIVITVSGYDDFEKVKTSFLNGTIDYLLKPVAQEKLVEVLTKAFSILEEREVQKKNHENSKENDLKLSSYLEDNEFSNLLNRKLYEGMENGGFLPNGKEFKDCSLMLIKFYDIFKSARIYDNDVLKMSYTIKSKIRKILGEGRDCILFNYTSKMSEYILITPYGSCNMGFIASEIYRAFSNEEYGPLSVVVSQRPSPMDEIGKRYREIIVESVSRPFNRSSCLLNCSDTLKQTKITESFGRNKQDALLRALNLGRLEDAHELIFNESGFEKCQEQNWTFIDVKQFTNQVRNTLLDIYTRKNRENLSQAEDLADTMEHSLDTLDYDGVKEAINALLEGLELDTEEMPTSLQAQTDQVRQFVLDNYRDNISLAVLAEKFHMEPNYLSRVFSQKYGETVTSYITTVRMDHAKEMIKDKSKKLETVSFLLGYDDYNYFSRVFKKHVGVSPTEYRKLHAET